MMKLLFLVPVAAALVTLTPRLTRRRSVIGMADAQGGEAQGQEEGLTEKRAAFLKAQGFHYDAERRVWTRGPSGMPKRRPAVARSPSSQRAVEVRFSDQASPALVATGRRAAQRFAETLQRSAFYSVPGSPRSELEKVGTAIASSKIGPLALVATQLFAWTAVRGTLNMEDLPPLSFVDSTTLPMFMSSCLFVAATLLGGGPLDEKKRSKTGYFIWGASSLSGTLEGVAADASRGAIAFPAPAAWRANDDKWRSIAALLDFVAAFPRILAVHAACQIPLETSIGRQLEMVELPNIGIPGIPGVAAFLAGLAVASFAAATETVTLMANDGELLQQEAVIAECAAVTEALVSSLQSEDNNDDTEIVFRALARAYLARFDPDQKSPDKRKKQNRDRVTTAAASAFSRTAAASAAFRLAGDDIVAPIALHGIAALTAVLAPKLQRLTFDDHDRVVVTLI